MMEAGGNAVDAAIALVVCLGVSDPHSTGLSGGFFMNVYNRRGGACLLQ